MNLYTSAGWIDTTLYFRENAAPLVVAIGGRGTGKTYGILSELIRRNEFFLMLRRQQSQLDALLSEQLNPFADYNRDHQDTIIPARIKGNKYLIGFYRGESDDEGNLKPAGPCLAMGAALSTFAGIRGLSGRDIKTVFFDEVIPEARERPIKDEEPAILNLYESINRNRELLGERPLRLIMATNSNNFKSRVLNAFGLLDDVEQMIRRHKSYRRTRAGAEIYNYWDSPISARKAGTFLYQAGRNESFNRMSLSNEFPEDDFEGVQPQPLQEYRPLVTIGDLTVYQHASERRYYVVAGKKAERRYTLLPNSKIAFRSDFVELYDALISGDLSYSTVRVKMEFEDIWRG